MKLVYYYGQRIILVALLACLGIICTHFYLNTKNQRICMERVKNCEKGLKKYSYSSRYIGKCKCNVVCNDK